MENITINDLIGGLKQFKKALKEWKKNTKEPVELFEQFAEQQLLIQRSVFATPTEVKDIQVEESPDGVPTQPGEPDLDLIAEQEAENTEVNPTGL